MTALDAAVRAEHRAMKRTSVPLEKIREVAKLLKTNGRKAVAKLAGVAPKTVRLIAEGVITVDTPRFREVVIGERFGRWTVVSDIRDVKPHAVHVRCDCGSESKVQWSGLVGGCTTSCGCYGRECASQRIRKMATKHGMTRTPEYRCWQALRNRCNNPSVCNYKFYGGRGIRVCDRWNESFEAFFADMGLRPSDVHSIERKDPNGSYCPENCIWIETRLQKKNMRSNFIIEHEGRSMCLGDWAKHFGVWHSPLGKRLRTGMSMPDAIADIKARRRK